MRKQAGYFTLLFFCFTFSLSANHVDKYISTYKDVAQREMRRSNIPASIILAQGIHESSWGRGELAVNSNNHFGIKCKDYWTGPTYYIEDDDFENGELIKSCFRAYDDEEASYIDHTDFLLNSERYQGLFLYDQTDYKNWAFGLKQCGYATDVQYAEKLIRIIETHQLYLFDMISTPVLEAPSFYIPAEFLSETEIQDPVIYEYDRPSETAIANVEGNYIEPSSKFDYEVVVEESSREEEEIPVSIREVIDYAIPEEMEENSISVSYDRTDLTGVIKNKSSRDKKRHNLSRKPRMSSASGPR